MIGNGKILLIYITCIFEGETSSLVELKLHNTLQDFPSYVWLYLVHKIKKFNYLWSLT